MCASITSNIKPLPLNICPIQFFLRSNIVSHSFLLCSTILSTSSLVFLSVQLTLAILLHNHISNASNLLFSSFLTVHVSLPYNCPGHTRVFASLDLKAMFILLHNIFFLLVKACLVIAILHLISCAHLPSSVIRAPKYLNC